MKRPVVASSNLEPRLSSLETSVESLTGDVRGLMHSIDSLRGMVEAGNRTQWGTIISGIGLSVVIIGAIGSAFIAPLAISTQGHEQILYDRGITIESVKDRLRELEASVATNNAVTAARFAAIGDIVDDIKKNGSGITRERLAILEHEVLTQKAVHKP